MDKPGPNQGLRARMLLEELSSLGSVPDPKSVMTPIPNMPSGSSSRTPSSSSANSDGSFNTRRNVENFKDALAAKYKSISARTREGSSPFNPVSPKDSDQQLSGSATPSPALSSASFSSAQSSIVSGIPDDDTPPSLGSASSSSSFKQSKGSLFDQMKNRNRSESSASDGPGSAKSFLSAQLNRLMNNNNNSSGNNIQNSDLDEGAAMSPDPRLGIASSNSSSGGGGIGALSSVLKKIDRGAMRGGAAAAADDDFEPSIITASSESSGGREAPSVSKSGNIISAVGDKFKDSFKSLKSMRGGQRIPRGKLAVTILRGENLIACDNNGFSDPFCIVQFEGTKQKTRVVRKTLNPVWKQSFDFEVYSSDPILVIEIWDWDQVGSNDFMGSVSVPLSDLMQDGEVHPMDLSPQEDDRGLAQGRLFFEYQYHPLSIVSTMRSTMRLVDNDDDFENDEDGSSGHEQRNKKSLLQRRMEKKTRSGGGEDDEEQEDESIEDEEYEDEDDEWSETPGKEPQEGGEGGLAKTLSMRYNEMELKKTRNALKRVQHLLHHRLEKTSESIARLEADYVQMISQEVRRTTESIDSRVAVAEERVDSLETRAHAVDERYEMVSDDLDTLFRRTDLMEEKAEEKVLELEVRVKLAEDRLVRLEQLSVELSRKTTTVARDVDEHHEDLRSVKAKMLKMEEKMSAIESQKTLAGRAKEWASLLLAWLISAVGMFMSFVGRIITRARQSVRIRFTRGNNKKLSGDENSGNSSSNSNDNMDMAAAGRLSAMENMFTSFGQRLNSRAENLRREAAGILSSSSSASASSSSEHSRSSSVSSSSSGHERSPSMDSEASLSSLDSAGLENAMNAAILANAMYSSSSKSGDDDVHSAHSPSSDSHLSPSVLSGLLVPRNKAQDIVEGEAAMHRHHRYNDSDDAQSASPDGTPLLMRAHNNNSSSSSSSMSSNATVIRHSGSSELSMDDMSDNDEAENENDDNKPSFAASALSQLRNRKSRMMALNNSSSSLQQPMLKGGASASSSRRSSFSLHSRNNSASGDGIWDPSSSDLPGSRGAAAQAAAARLQQQQRLQRGVSSRGSPVMMQRTMSSSNDENQQSSNSSKPAKQVESDSEDDAADVHPYDPSEPLTIPTKPVSQNQSSKNISYGYGKGSAQSSSSAAVAPVAPSLPTPPVSAAAVVAPSRPVGMMSGWQRLQNMSR